MRLWVTVAVTVPDGDQGKLEEGVVLVAAKNALDGRGENAIVGWENPDWQDDPKGEA